MKNIFIGAGAGLALSMVLPKLLILALLFVSIMALIGVTNVED